MPDRKSMDPADLPTMTAEHRQLAEKLLPTQRKRVHALRDRAVLLEQYLKIDPDDSWWETHGEHPWQEDIDITRARLLLAETEYLAYSALLRQLAINAL